MQQLIGTELEVSCKNEDSLLVKVTVQLYVLGIERDIAVDNVNVGYLENRYCVESWSLLRGNAGWQT